MPNRHGRLLLFDTPKQFQAAQFRQPQEDSRRQGRFPLQKWRCRKPARTSIGRPLTGRGGKTAGEKSPCGKKKCLRQRRKVLILRMRFALSGCPFRAKRLSVSTETQQSFGRNASGRSSRFFAGSSRNFAASVFFAHGRLCGVAICDTRPATKKSPCATKKTQGLSQ